MIRYIIKKKNILKKIMELSDNWNSYGAKSFNNKIYYNTLKILNAIPKKFLNFYIVPFDGGIQFEWHYRNKYLELEISDKNNIEYLKIDNKNNEENEININNKKEIIKIIKWMEK